MTNVHNILTIIIKVVIISLIITAGGLATYFHADYVQNTLPSSTKYKTMADAG